MSTRLRATLARAIVCGRACTHTSPDFSARHAHRCSPIGHRYTNQRTLSNPTLFSYSLALRPFFLPPSRLYIPTFLRSRVSRVHRGIVRTYVQKEGGRERERKRRERRLTLESTIGERVCARVVDDAPRTRVKSRGEGIPALPLPPRRRGVHRVSLRPTYPPSSSFSPLAAPALPPRLQPPSPSTSRARDALTHHQPPVGPFREWRQVEQGDGGGDRRTRVAGGSRGESDQRKRDGE